MTGRIIIDYSSRDRTDDDADGDAAAEDGAAAQPAGGAAALRPAFAGASPLGIFAAVASTMLCVAAWSKTQWFTFTPKYFVVPADRRRGRRAARPPRVDVVGRRMGRRGRPSRSSPSRLVAALVSPSVNIGILRPVPMGHGMAAVARRRRGVRDRGEPRADRSPVALRRPHRRHDRERAGRRVAGGQRTPRRRASRCSRARRPTGCSGTRSTSRRSCSVGSPSCSDGCAASPCGGGRWRSCSPSRWSSPWSASPSRCWCCWCSTRCTPTASAAVASTP